MLRAVVDLPEEIWFLILGHVIADGWLWQRWRARRICRAFCAALTPVAWPTRHMRLHVPGLCEYASRSLERSAIGGRWPEARVLAHATARTCMLCKRRYAGGFVEFLPPPTSERAAHPLLVYAHGKCIRDRCIATYWVEHPRRESMPPDLYDHCGQPRPGGRAPTLDVPRVQPVEWSVFVRPRLRATRGRRGAVRVYRVGERGVTTTKKGGGE